MQIDGANNQLITPAAVNQRPPPNGGPPPPGSTPPGLENAVSTLSQEEQDSVFLSLKALSKEQQDELKSILDELQSRATSMSDEEIGQSFLTALNSISSNTSQTNSTNIIDTFA
tara:strand:- start:1357 stop:1698 length:342 start_codon:yes stop_codon:yes gene_type:complete